MQRLEQSTGLVQEQSECLTALYAICLAYYLAPSLNSGHANSRQVALLTTAPASQVDNLPADIKMVALSVLFCVGPDPRLLRSRVLPALWVTANIAKVHHATLPFVDLSREATDACEIPAQAH